MCFWAVHVRDFSVRFRAKFTPSGRVGIKPSLDTGANLAEIG